MSTLEQIRSGLGRAWETLSDGWQQLYRRAGHALTRFSPAPRSGTLETSEQQRVREGSRWALLAAEVHEDDRQLVVRLEAPGMEPGDFEIQVIDNILVIRGEKQVRREHSHGQYHLLECAYGRFERAIPLPVPADESGAKAHYRRGVLTVTLPKLSPSRARRIEVEGV
ncbi:MAG TPA: Hsp20/alpha crystallin family protein [Gammaproteobacteria bacterium]|nr:Hsp20/alpha crystallin family protein [Gammaproteobacteria bacterium]